MPAMSLTPQEILQSLDLDSISGLTFSGGEPMEQAAALAELARLARAQKDLNLICFSGYRYERLVNHPPNPGVVALLAEIDVLIDGPFIQSLNDSKGLRGSTNQRIIHLTSKLRDHDFESQTRTVEITITDGELSFVGIPTSAMLTAMKQANYAGPERME
jgi:anaerobic ribonucleoside-triphosphate reductase activating protein